MSDTPNITLWDLSAELGQTVDTTADQIKHWISLQEGESAYIRHTTRLCLNDWVVKGPAADLLRQRVARVREVEPEAPDNDPLELPDTPPLERIAALLIRQDMAAEDAVRSWNRVRESDSAVLDWALATAGHLFDSHELWDYDWIKSAEHVHRCTEHRHEGPGTRGFRL